MLGPVEFLAPRDEWEEISKRLRALAVAKERVIREASVYRSSRTPFISGIAPTSQALACALALNPLDERTDAFRFIRQFPSQFLVKSHVFCHSFVS